MAGLDPVVPMGKKYNKNNLIIGNHLDSRAKRGHDGEGAPPYLLNESVR